MEHVLWVLFQGTVISVRPLPTSMGKKVISLTRSVFPLVKNVARFVFDKQRMRVATAVKSGYFSNNSNNSKATETGDRLVRRLSRYNPTTQNKTALLKHSI